jgi:type II secretory pathway component PulK
MTHNNKPKGAALIAVMVIVFLVMVIISNITIKNFRIISRLTNQNIQQQAAGILVVGTNFGRAGLATSAATSKVDTINDIWAQPLPKTKIIGDFMVSGYITDEQSKFNINDLVIKGKVNKQVLAQFTQLLEYLKIPSGIASNIALYMASPAYQADIMSSYSTADPPSSPAGRPLVDMSELILVQGMQSSWLYKLQQYATVIPQNFDFNKNESGNESGSKNKTPGTVASNTPSESKPAESTTLTWTPSMPANSSMIQINVNTASAEVIAAKSGIPLAIAGRMVAQRNNNPFKSAQDITTFFSNNGIIPNQNESQSKQKTDPGTLTTQSSYFIIHAVVDKDDFQFTLASFVYRADRSGQWPKLIWQHPE